MPLFTSFFKDHFGKIEAQIDDDNLHEELQYFFELEKAYSTKLELASAFAKQWDEGKLQELQKWVKTLEKLAESEEEIIKRFKERIKSKDQNLRLAMAISKGDQKETDEGKRIHSDFRKLQRVLELEEAPITNQIGFFRRTKGDVVSVRRAIGSLLDSIHLEGRILHAGHPLLEDLESHSEFYNAKVSREKQRKRMLEKWGFDFKAHPKLGYFLLMNWNLTIPLFKHFRSDGTKEQFNYSIREFIKSGVLIEVEDLLYSDFPFFVSISYDTIYSTGKAFSSINALRPVIQKIGWKKFSIVFKVMVNNVSKLKKDGYKNKLYYLLNDILPNFTGALMEIDFGEFFDELPRILSNIDRLGHLDWNTLAQHVNNNNWKFYAFTLGILDNEFTYYTLQNNYMMFERISEHISWNEMRRAAVIVYDKYKKPILVNSFFYDTLATIISRYKNLTAGHILNDLIELLSYSSFEKEIKLLPGTESDFINDKTWQYIMKLCRDIRQSPYSLISITIKLENCIMEIGWPKYIQFMNKLNEICPDNKREFLFRFLLSRFFDGIYEYKEKIGDFEYFQNACYALVSLSQEGLDEKHLLNVIYFALESYTFQHVIKSNHELAKQIFLILYNLTKGFEYKVKGHFIETSLSRVIRSDNFDIEDLRKSGEVLRKYYSLDEDKNRIMDILYLVIESRLRTENPEHLDKILSLIFSFSKGLELDDVRNLIKTLSEIEDIDSMQTIGNAIVVFIRNYEFDGSLTANMIRCLLACKTLIVYKQIPINNILNILHERLKNLDNEQRELFTRGLQLNANLISDINSLIIYSCISFEIAKKTDNLYSVIMNNNALHTSIIEAFVNEIPKDPHDSDKLPNIFKKIITYDKIKIFCARNFFGEEYDDKELKSFVGNLDMRILTTKHPEDVKELIGLSHKMGETRYRRWYIARNIKSLKNLKSYGINLRLWLGYDQLHLVERAILPGLKDVSPEEHRKKALNEQFKLFNRTFTILFSSDMIPNEKNREDLFEKVIEKTSNVLSVSKKELATPKDYLQVVLQQLAKIPHVIEKAILPAIQDDTKMSKIINPNKSDTFFGSRGDLEQIRDSVNKIIKGQSEKGRILEISFNVSRKVPLNITIETKWKKGVSQFFQPSVLTIGNDGGCCIAMGGANEFAGYNFFLDSDALLVNIMDKNKKRVGMILAFAALENNQPILALNTVETPFRSDPEMYPLFCDVCMQMLSVFAHEAGFKKIVIGKGYGSGYFKEAYNPIKIDMRKMNPYKSKNRYYTNAFEHGNIEQTEEGDVSVYSGEGSLIWDYKQGITKNKLAQDSIRYNIEYKVA